MNARSLFVAGLHLLGIYQLADVFSSLAMLLDPASTAIHIFPGPHGLYQLIVNAASGLILTVGTRRIATCLGYDAQPQTTAEIAEESLIRAGISIIGILWLFPFLTGLFEMACIYFIQGRTPNWVIGFGTLFLFTCALLLILGAARIARLAIRIRF
ncbi:MAG: hypothetical protein PW734_07885 [Verrucomicrobium sp.]|nr:hypothetical protein [Verrucomicrobium sp.]